MRYLIPTSLAISVALAIGPAARAEPMPSQQEMWRIIQAQQQQIEALQQQLNTTDVKVHATDAKADAAVSVAEAAGREVAPVARWAERTQIGGYGELHYNNLEGAGGAADKDEVDFHRFVLFFGHQFTDGIRFSSELELEHAVSEADAAGAVELEQAYLELDLTPHHHVTAGLQLIPVGILNETHEPPTFYGVERNPVETNILPSTWREAGLGMHGEVAPNVVPGLSYNVLLHSGLETPVAGGNAFKIRNGRNGVSEASAADGAVTGQLKWTALPGVELGGAVQYQRDITQGAGNLKIDAFLFETHADIRRGPFGLRALYARWNLDDGALGFGPSTGPSVGREVQYGWYVEPSYRTRVAYIPGELGMFMRFNQWDNNAGASGNSEERQYNVGMNYWPTPDVVFKADVQFQDNENGRDQDGFNLGVGYQF